MNIRYFLFLALSGIFIGNGNAIAKTLSSATMVEESASKLRLKLEFTGNTFVIKKLQFKQDFC